MKARTVAGRGEKKGLLCDPGSQLRTSWKEREKKMCGDNEWDAKKNNNKKISRQYSTGSREGTTAALFFVPYTTAVTLNETVRQAVRPLTHTRVGGLFFLVLVEGKIQPSIRFRLAAGNPPILKDHPCFKTRFST